VASGPPATPASLPALVPRPSETLQALGIYTESWNALERLVRRLGWSQFKVVREGAGHLCNFPLARIIHQQVDSVILEGTLRIHWKRHILFLFALSCGLLRAASTVVPESVVESYWAASQSQDKVLNGASMEVDIDASLPKLKKHGRLRALRRISSLGRITYEHLRFEGDNTVKSNVIARYLSAEAQAQAEQAPSLAVTPANYKFKYKGLQQWQGETVHVFQVAPRHKRVGLFKGEVWIDANTCLRVRESGRLVKNPSIFIKKIEFVREYEIRDGISVPRQTRSVVYTRLVGPAELTIDFRNVSFAEGPRRASLVDVDAQ
jgi:hypothetical protein